MSWTTLRTIKEELDVEALVDVLTEKHARFAEIWEGIKWLLCRTPNLRGAAKYGKYRLYVFAGDAVADTPDVWVVYTFDENEVVILGVTTSPRDDGNGNASSKHHPRQPKAKRTPGTPRTHRGKPAKRGIAGSNRRPRR